MKKFFLFITFIIIVNAIYAQNVVQRIDTNGRLAININEGEKLKKLISKDELSLVRTLRISGSITTSDIGYLKKAESLKALELEGINFGGYEILTGIFNEILEVIPYKGLIINGTVSNSNFSYFKDPDGRELLDFQYMSLKNEKERNFLTYYDNNIKKSYNSSIIIAEGVDYSFLDNEDIIVAKKPSSNGTISFSSYGYKSEFEPGELNLHFYKEQLSLVKNLIVLENLYPTDVNFILDSLPNVESLHLYCAGILQEGDKNGKPNSYGYPKTDFVLPAKHFKEFTPPSNCNKLIVKQNGTCSIYILRKCHNIESVTGTIEVDEYYTSMFDCFKNPNIRAKNYFWGFEDITQSTKKMMTSHFNIEKKHTLPYLFIEGNEYDNEKEYYRSRRLNDRPDKPSIFALFVENESGIKKFDRIDMSKIEPVFLYLWEKNYLSLVHYDDTSSHVKLSELGVDMLSEIEPYAFYGHSEIDSIDLNVDGLTYLGAYAFAGTNFKTITIPNSITQISPWAFDGSAIEEVRLESDVAPVLKDKYEDFATQYHDMKVYNSKRIKSISFIIPMGTKEKLVIGDWKELCVLEEGTQTDYEFTVKKEGTLNEYINDSIAPCIHNLVLRGFLDDTDLETLRKCKYIKKLDMSNCFIIKSYATKQKELDEQYNEACAIGWVLNIHIDKSDYICKKVSVSSLVGTTDPILYYNKLKNQYENGNVIADENCSMPYDAFGGLCALREFIYPIQMKYADVNLPGTIENVVFPPMATYIGGCGGCKNLKHIDVPASVENIGVIKQCTLDELDLSNTRITKFPEGFLEDCTIGVFKAPRTLESSWNLHMVGVISEAYFYTRERTNGFPDSFSKYNKNPKIHIPKGTKASWGNSDNIVDDIEE